MKRTVAAPARAAPGPAAVSDPDPDAAKPIGQPHTQPRALVALPEPVADHAPGPVTVSESADRLHPPLVGIHHAALLARRGQRVRVEAEGERRTARSKRIWRL